jgi:spore germination protein GerM
MQFTARSGLPAALLAGLAALALAVGCGGGSGGGYGGATTAAPAGTVVVWFADDQGALVAESRPRPAGADPLETALAELASGPRGAGLLPGLPPGTRVLSARRDGDLAVVDLSAEFAEGYPTGGSAAEIATVGPVVLTAAAASGARAVRILVEGAAPVTPGAQLDLSRPVAPGDLPAP